MQRSFAQKAVFEGKHAELSEQIIKFFYEVHNELGFGFSEKVYQNVLALLLRETGLQVDEQLPIKVYFHGKVVGEYIADIVINDVILLELKTVSNIASEHEAQLLNYLKATNIEVGYIMNFGKSATNAKDRCIGQRNKNLRANP